MIKWTNVDDGRPSSADWVLVEFFGTVEQGYYDGAGCWWLTRTDSYDERIQAFPRVWSPMPKLPWESD